MSFVMLMQSNRDAASMDRKKQGYQEPMPSDLKDSGGLTKIYIKNLGDLKFFFYICTITLKIYKYD